ncbi:MAG: hypothetical protein DMF97_06705 [Acidobacteria bacterium]|nr:MAG: hypothetical protein DMF97_06705 [Acidobacteriota bacterium]
MKESLLADAMIGSHDSDKAAFEVGKGSTKIMVLSEEQVMRFLDPNDLLRELESSFGALARGEVQCPPRPEVSIPGRGFSLTMVAWQPGMQICVKVVNVFDGNLKLGLPNHLALINLFDPDTGAATCVMDGTYITGIRTAAAAVVSHKLLSRPDSRVATIVGAGVQAREHLRLLPLVRDLEEIQIASLEFEHAEHLARLDPPVRHRLPRDTFADTGDRCRLGQGRDSCIVGWLSPATR